MRVLWAPWRLAYVEKDEHAGGCVFCDKPPMLASSERRDGLVLYSDEYASVIMNRYPYANAHLMVAPRAHTAEFAAMPARDAAALTGVVQKTVAVLDRAYSPQGFNVGLNLGRSAGAGIDDHLHWHVVPRWEGDTNFMPLLADCRVLPEHLDAAYERLLPLFASKGGV